jgi:hypothetical protein
MAPMMFDDPPPASLHIVTLDEFFDVLDRYEDERLV